MANQQNLPVLPTDIFEPIIKALASSSDLSSIKSLCLVNTFLVHPCQKEIFRTLEIEYIPPTGPYRPIKQFMAAYLRRPTLASYICDFRLWIEFHDYQTLHLAASLLSSVHLKNVRSFQLAFKEEPSFATPTRMEMTAIPDQFVTALCKFITANTLEQLQLWQINHFPITIFNYLPHLRELLLYNIGFAHAPVPQFLRECPTSMPLLRELHLKRNISGAMLDILNQKKPVFDLSQLEDLMVYLEDEKGKDMLSTRLFSISQGLRKLAVGGPCPQIDRLKHFTENIHPKSLQALKTLEFLVVLEKSGQDPLASIINELAVISRRTNLEELHLSIDIEEDLRCPVSADFWGRLESVLVPKESFPTLKRVDIEITIMQCESTDYKEFAAQLKDIGKNSFAHLDKVVDLTLEVRVIFFD